jgi:predicted  nucleic acid-binding Zn-ribbon protein
MKNSDKILVKLQHILKLEIKIMAKLDEVVAALEVSLDSAVARINNNFNILGQQIADLQNQIASNTTSPEALSKLSTIQSKLDALVP